MIDAFLNGDKLVTSNDLAKELFSTKSVQLIDSSKDLNTVQLGFVRSFGSKPQNAPEALQPWAIYFTISMDEEKTTMAQFGIDSDGQIYARTKGGDPSKWNDWYVVATQK